MKKILFLLFFLSLSFPVFSQEIDSLSSKTEQEIISPDSILVDISDLVYVIEARVTQIYRNNCPKYKMYSTENIYNLLKLDTQTGRIWQVQWSLDGNEGTWEVNNYDLSIVGSHFELYPTRNMYQFILLDTTNGRTWHVQWGTEKNKRWINRIY